MKKKDKKTSDTLIRGDWMLADIFALKTLYRNRSTDEVAAYLGRPRGAVKKKASRLHLRKSRKYLRSREYRKLLAHAVILMAVLCLFCGNARAAEPNDRPGLTAWVLGGIGTEDRAEELRLGYEGLLPNIEFAVGGKHKEAPDPEVDEWSFRGYAIAHALDAQMLASLWNKEIPLPNGNLYAGLFTEYSHDRDNEWSGGYVIGALVDWPTGWQTVAEYGKTTFNTDVNQYEFMLGLRKEF